MTSEADLRRKTKQRLRKKRAKSDQSARPRHKPVENDSLALAQELQVHQIELQMQNEELMLALADKKALSEKYIDLFDFVPIGHLLWNEQGKILEINLAGAALLGLEREAAIKKRFSGFVALEDRPAFAEFLKRIFQSGDKQICEIGLLTRISHHPYRKRLPFVA